MTDQGTDQGAHAGQTARADAGPAADATTRVRGIHHVGVVTGDLDRFVAFYRTTFGARVVFDAVHDGVRNALVEVGSGQLQVIQAAGEATPRPDRARSEGVRLNHFALGVPTRDAFLDMRRRLVDAGRSDGRVRDAGAAWSLKYRDPDGFESELIWVVDPDGELTTSPRVYTADEVPAAGGPGASGSGAS